MGYFFTFVPLFRSTCINNIFCLAGIVGKVSRYKEIFAAIHIAFISPLCINLFLAQLQLDYL